MTAKEQIENYLTLKNISVRKMAHRCKVSHEMLYKVLRGEEIGIKSATRIAYTLNIKLALFEVSGGVPAEFEMIRCKYEELRELSSRQVVCRAVPVKNSTSEDFYIK